ncbi:MAG: hypothetical protein ABFD89_13385 [Bryobacteraceae bacterium]
MKDASTRPMASFGRRAASYWFVDGLPQAVFGLALLVSGAMELLWRMYAPHPKAGHYLAVGTGFFLYFYIGTRILDLLKSRVTYPRTGYVQPPEETQRLIGEPLTTLSLRPVPQPKENVTSFGWRTVIVIYFFLVTPWDGSPRWFVPVLMAAIAATLYALNRVSEHPYRWWSTLVLGLTGLVSLLADVPPLLQPLLPLLLVGLWLVGQGGWTLINYLRQNPQPRISEGVRA